MHFQDEGQLKVKRDPKKVVLGTPAPAELFAKVLPKHVSRLLTFNKLRARGATAAVSHGDVREVCRKLVNQVDLVVTSPPYINAMNYPMVHRYENILLGLLDPNRKIAHEREYIGTERVHAREYAELPQCSEHWPFAKELNVKLTTIFGRERKRAYVVYRYFKDCEESFSAIAETLKRGKHMVLIAGRNRIKQVQIPTFEYLTALLELFELKLEYQFDYELIKHAFKLTRHETADLIKVDGLAVLRKS